MGRLGLAGIVAMLLLGGPGCGSGGHRDAAPERTNLLLVSLDTVRADHTSLLGYSRPTTPRLERLASQGVSFRRAYTMSSTTGPSHATLFTGRYAPVHGAARNGMSLRDDLVTLAEHLHQRGYRTGGVLGSFVLAGRFGFGQGFDDWDDSFRRETSSLPMKHWEGQDIPGGAFDRGGAEVTRLAVDWLEEHRRDQPFFLFVHYFDAHEPYTPKPPDLAHLASAPLDPDTDEGVSDAAAKVIRRYDAEIAGVDRELGELLDRLKELGLDERTLVVVASDHGQGLTDHNDSKHGVNIYEECVRGVLVFRGPRIAPPGRTSDAAVEAVDVLPTVLDLLDPGSQQGLGLPGHSLAGYLRGLAGPPVGWPVFLFRQLYGPRHRVRNAMVSGAEYGIRVRGWKYIEGGRDGHRELYDIANDPDELDNLARDEPERAAELRARLHEWRASHPLPHGASPSLSEGDRARLRALGYLQ
jgi:arylsulfatase A-like enzyme